MVSIATYLKQGGSLVPLDEFSGPIDDEDYIEGAIELTINHVPLLTTAQADYVDQLWAYLIGGMAGEVKRGEPFATYFPDCPIEVTLRPEPAKQQIVVGVNLQQKRGPVSAAAPMHEFKQAFVDEARRFFAVLAPLTPGHRGAYEKLIKQLDGI